MDKNERRKQGIRARKALASPESYSKRINCSLLSSPPYKNAKVIFTYIPFNGEADVSYFNRQAHDDGKVVAYPICDGNGIMVAAVPESETAWETGMYGIKSPSRESSRILSPKEIDLVIVPCTVFDANTKIRIGMGAGYYDRYLPECKNAKCVAVAFEAQKQEDLCADEWDFPLDAVVTEISWY